MEDLQALLAQAFLNGNTQGATAPPEDIWRILGGGPDSVMPDLSALLAALGANQAFVPGGTPAQPQAPSQNSALPAGVLPGGPGGSTPRPQDNTQGPAVSAQPEAPPASPAQAPGQPSFFADVLPPQTVAAQPDPNPPPAQEAFPTLPDASFLFGPPQGGQSDASAPAPAVGPSARSGARRGPATAQAPRVSPAPRHPGQGSSPQAPASSPAPAARPIDPESLGINTRWMVNNQDNPLLAVAEREKIRGQLQQQGLAQLLTEDLGRRGRGRGPDR